MLSLLPLLALYHGISETDKANMLTKHHKTALPVLLFHLVINFKRLDVSLHLTSSCLNILFRAS